MTPNNPYNYNMPASSEMFYGRKQKLQAILKDITALPGDSCALIGGRRIGKTSLLENLLLELEKSQNELGTYYFLLFFDLGRGDFNSLSEFYQLIIDNINRIIKNEGLIKPINLKADHPPAPIFGDFLLRVNQSMIKSKGRSIRLILLIDECEHAVNNVWSSELYTTLRYLLTGYQTRNLIKVVMSGGHQFLSKVQENGSPLRNILKYYTLSALDINSAKQLISTPNNDLLSELNVREIIKQSGCHPFLLQYLLHNVWENGIEITNPNKIINIAHAFAHERHDFQDWLNSLSYAGKTVYKTLVDLSFPLSSIELRTKFINMPEDFSQGVEVLLYHGLISYENEEYRVNGLMFKNWFKLNYIGLEKDDTKRIFEAINAKAKSLSPGKSKENAIAVLKELELEVVKGDDVDIKKTKEHLEFLYALAPDIWEVAINSLSNPLNGINTVIKKIAERAKLENKQK